MPWKTHRPLGNRAEIKRRESELWAPNVAPLNEMVRRIRRETGDETVPWLDPSGAGVDAKVLLLLRDPSNAADPITKQGTGFISPDNPDRTADNITWLRGQAGLLPSELVHWTAVPWRIADGVSVRDQIRQATPFLKEFVRYLQGLRAVVCMGHDARKAWELAFPNLPPQKGWNRSSRAAQADLVVVWCPHPSWHNMTGGNKRILWTGLRRKIACSARYEPCERPWVERGKAVSPLTTVCAQRDGNVARSSLRSTLDV